MVQLNTWLSLEVTTPGHVRSHLYHGGQRWHDGRWVEGWGTVAPYDNRASNWKSCVFRFVLGLANSGLVSIESQEYPGHFLRHKDWRVILSPNDGSDLFKKDATWAIREVGNGNVRIESCNYPTFLIRHFNSQLWISAPRGNTPENSPHLYVEDSTFKIVSPIGP